jgi:chromosomal replication initiation ATPase DnaA
MTAIQISHANPQSASAIIANAKAVRGRLWPVSRVRNYKRNDITRPVPIYILDAINKVEDVLIEPSFAPTKVNVIISVVASHFGVTLVDIKSARRTHTVILPRHIALYIARTTTRFSLPQIAKFFGGRDHTTALHGYNKIAALLETDATLRETIDMLTAKIRGG